MTRCWAAPAALAVAAGNCCVRCLSHSFVCIALFAQGAPDSVSVAVAFEVAFTFAYSHIHIFAIAIAIALEFARHIRRAIFSSGRSTYTIRLHIKYEYENIIESRLFIQLNQNS